MVVKTVVQADEAADANILAGVVAEVGAHALVGSQEPAPASPEEGSGGSLTPAEADAALATSITMGEFLDQNVRGTTLGSAVPHHAPMMFIGVPAAHPLDEKIEHPWGVTLDVTAIYNMRNHPTRQVKGPGEKIIPGPLSARWVCSATLRCAEVVEKLEQYFKDTIGYGAVVWFAGHG